MPISFYLISTIVFAVIVFIFYREALAYAKKEFAQKRISARVGALRPVLALSLVATVLVMLVVQYFFY